MQQTKSHQERYAGWKASPSVYRVHTIVISAYCTLMISSLGLAAEGLREIIEASLVVFR